MVSHIGDGNGYNFCTSLQDMLALIKQEEINKLDQEKKLEKDTGESAQQELRECKNSRQRFSWLDLD